MCELIDFSNVSMLKDQITADLSIVEYNFEEPDPIPPQFEMVFKIDLPHQDMPVMIGLSKNTSYKLEVVTNLTFDPPHVEVLRKNKDNVKEKMIETLQMWLLPRPGHFSIELFEDNDFENSHILNMIPIYKGEYTFGNLLRAIDQVVSYTLLSRKIIQSNLNQYIEEIDQ